MKSKHTLSSIILSFFAQIETQTVFNETEKTNAPGRESERKTSEVYEDMPLFQLEQEYGGTESGRKLGLHEPYLAVFSVHPYG